MLLDQNHPMIDKFKLSAVHIFECSAPKLFELAFSDDAPMPFDQFWKDLIPTKN